MDQSVKTLALNQSELEYWTLYYDISGESYIAPTSNARPSVVTRDGRATFGVQKVYHIDYDRSVFICTGLVMQFRGTTNSLNR